MAIAGEGQNARYMLEKASDGGFIVWSSKDQGFDKQAMFACSKVEDAFKYMDGQLEKKQGDA